MPKRTRFSDGTTGIDLTGQKFGKLTVIEYAGKNKDNRAMFYCECECGKRDVAVGTYLVKKRQQDCGCISGSKGKNLNIIGKTFNELTATKRVGINPKGHVLYEFKCSCGNTKVIVGSQVANGRTKSCGCLTKAKKYDIIGKTFDKLTALKFVGSDKNNNYLYEFKCSCGNIVVLPASRVRAGTTKSCGCLVSDPDLSIIGKKFNMLTALRFVGRNNNSRNNAMYEFQCECGNKKIIRGTHVTRGGTKSCGCLFKKIRLGIRSDSEARSHIGEVHNRITIIDIERDDKDSGYRMVCKCSCGSDKRILSTYTKIVRGEVQSCGCYKSEVTSILGSTIGIHNGRSAGRMQWNVDGMYLRSGLEVLFVLGLKNFHMKFEYEPKVIKLKDGLRYRPDFYLPEIDTWVEVKGFMKGKDQEKLEAFAAMGHKVKLYMQKDVEAFAGMTYNQLYTSKKYRKIQLPPQALQSKLLVQE